MATYQLTALAREDLREVARYTVKTWGTKQARRYQVSLESFFEAIAENKIQGHTFTRRRPDLLFARCEHHFVFFLRRENSCPLILAVFHEKMDLMMRMRKRLQD